MLKNEWNDFFEIEEVYDSGELAVNVSSALYKAADEVLAALYNAEETLTANSPLSYTSSISKKSFHSFFNITALSFNI